MLLFVLENEPNGLIETTSDAGGVVVGVVGAAEDDTTAAAYAHTEQPLQCLQDSAFLSGAESGAMQ